MKIAWLNTGTCPPLAVRKRNYLVFLGFYLTNFPRIFSL